jgi:hypothetical protein
MPKERPRHIQRNGVAVSFFLLEHMPNCPRLVKTVRIFSF